MGVLRDERGFVTGSLGRAVLFLVFVSVPLFDFGSIAVNYLGLDAAAQDVAVTASTTHMPGEVLTPQVVHHSAQRAADERNAILVKAELENEVVTVKLKREAKTLLMGRFETFRKWVVAKAEASSRTK